MLDLALHYARLGWPVFPLVPGTKDPFKGSHCFKDATLNANSIEEWWHQEPLANIGVATGRRAGLLVIDVDPRKTTGWLDSLRELELPQTFTVRTCSGGWHLYFSFSGDQRITVGADLLPGIDWRANGGYVVAVGSVVNGATYMIAKQLPIAPAPANLLERLVTAKRARRIERDVSGNVVIRKSRRNDTLMRIGCAIRRWGPEYNAILAALRAVNADHCEPPLDDDELRQIAASAARYEAAGEPKGAA